MSEPEPRCSDRGLRFWTVVLLLVVAVYVGAIYAAVERNWCSRDGYWVAHYRLPQGNQYPSLWTKPFAPIHWLDRRIRSEFWTAQVLVHPPF